LKKSTALATVFVALILLIDVVALQNTGQNQAPPGTEKARKDAHVIMISIDGLLPEYYTSPAKLGLKVPNLTRMKLNGSYADGVEGVYPTVTYPAHTTLITGARPVTHGIIQNRVFEPPPATPTREWYWYANALKSETLWSIARKAGLVTANVGWPVTVGADIDYNVPEIMDPKDRTSPARTIQYSTPGLLAKVAEANPQGDQTTDGRRTAASEFIITNYKPNLMLIHLIELDGSHHDNGPRSAAALPVAEKMDACVGRIIEATKKAGIFEKTTFFLVSDHGFLPVEKRFEPGVVLVKEKLITLDSAGKPSDWKAFPWTAGGSCAIVLRDPSDQDTAARVAEIFGKIAKRTGGPLYRVVGRTDLDRLGAIPTATLMLDAASGYSFGDEFSGPEIHESKNYRGTHGHLPSRHDLRSSLIIYGEAARLGARVAVARMIDIGPTAAAALGLALPNAEGLAIRELLRSDLAIPTIPKKKPASNTK
jgi:predicted AlkP superfamily pyrophosphatase or phosphodiesterase